MCVRVLLGEQKGPHTIPKCIMSIINYYRLITQINVYKCILSQDRLDWSQSVEPILPVRYQFTGINVLNEIKINQEINYLQIMADRPSTSMTQILCISIHLHIESILQIVLVWSQLIDTHIRFIGYLATNNFCSNKKLPQVNCVCNSRSDQTFVTHTPYI